MARDNHKWKSRDFHKLKFFSLILLKLAVIKGAIIGALIGSAASRRGRRDVDNEAMKEMLVRASQQDDDDCAKKLVLNQIIKTRFGLRDQLCSM